LVHVSTFAVYEPFPDGRLSEETGDGDRSNIYVNTKLPLEKIFFEATHKLGVQSTIVQPSIVYGPFCGVWTNHPTEILLSGDVILPDCGKGLCNAVYVDDVVDGLILAAISPEAVGERFILSGPQPVTWAAFFAKIAEEIGAQPPQFWPYERIAKANDGVSQTVLWDPKRLIRAIGKSNAVRHLLRTVLKAIPDRLRDTIMTFYFDEGQRGRGISLPSRHLLAFYRSKAVADSGKARLRLGYQPHFDFHRGITLTGSYLRWAYETRLSRKRSFAVRRGTGF